MFFSDHNGIPGLLTSGYSVQSDSLSVANSIVPWGSRCDYLIAIHDSNLLVADTSQLEVLEQDNLGRDPRDIASKIGGLAGKASGEKFSSFFKVLGSQAK